MPEGGRKARRRSLSPKAVEKSELRFLRGSLETLPESLSALLLGNILPVRY